MLVQISDVIIPEVYNTYGFVPNPALLTFINSGAVRRDPFLDSVANRGGRITTIPFWNDLDASTDPNISNDDPTQLASPQKIGSGELKVPIADYNNGWSAADLAGMLAGSDPMPVIKSRTSNYWSLQMQTFLSKIAMGIADLNVASNGSDMVNDISIATGNTAAPANLFSHNALIDATATAGEFFTQMTAMIVPMTVYWNMVKQNNISFVQPSDSKIQIPVYAGQYIVLRVADTLLSKPAATNGRKYYTVLCGPGVFAFGEGQARVPSEIRREPAQGNGGGTESLWERIRWTFGVAGHSWTDASVALDSPSSTEWGLAANWQRKYSRNLIPLAYLVTNG